MQLTRIRDLQDLDVHFQDIFLSTSGDSPQKKPRGVLSFRAAAEENAGEVPQHPFCQGKTACTKASRRFEGGGGDGGNGKNWNDNQNEDIPFSYGSMFVVVPS